MTSPHRSISPRIVGLFVARLDASVRRAWAQRILQAGAPQDLHKIVYEFPLLMSALADRNAYDAARRMFERLEGEGVGVVALGDPCYPVRLAHIEDPPPLLFWRGGSFASIEHTPCIAIVGSRSADVAGCRIARSLAQDAARRGYCVVSGLALGIDGAAHEGAVNGGGELPTIAVLGNGLSSVYPRTHQQLSERMLSHGGILVSQFEPEERPYPANFLNRNRIIAGLSHVTVVVQAAARSGALSTARCALEAGREVFAVPGPIDDPRYIGTNHLIKEGATLLTSIDDLIDALPFKPTPQHTEDQDKAHTNSLTTDEQAILNVLQQEGALHPDQISEHLPNTPLAQPLLQLELRGAIERLPGNLYAPNLK